MNERELAELLRYSSPKELYIIDRKGVLRLLKCPFLVIVIRSVGNLKRRQKVSVDEVRITIELITVFVIKDKAYYYYHFEILYHS